MFFNIESDDITLPKDAKPHPHSNIEWWYFFSFLQGDKGNNYAIMGSFFRVGESECLKGHYLIYTIIDLNTNTHKSYSFIDQKLKINMVSMYLPFYLLLHPTDTKMWKLYRSLLLCQIPSPHQIMKEVKVIRRPLSLKYGANTLAFHGEKLESFDLSLHHKEEPFQLTFTPSKPIALIGEDGKPDELYYYSFTRNSVNGKLTHKDGSIENLSGIGWFDHQWGREYSLAKGTGWNWFGLQLDDDRELLLNEMRSSKTGETFEPMANLIEHDGTVRFSINIQFYETGYWKSLKTNAKYPIEWEIVIPDFGIKLHVESLFKAQEMPALGPLQAIWEGVVTFRGKEHNNTISGKGFMELVGYSYSAYI